jgi:hypothetical protein
VDATPTSGGGVSRIDAERFNNVDRLQDLVDLGPVANCAAESYRQAAHSARSAALARLHRMQNVDARKDGTVTVRGRAEDGEHGAGRERCVSPVAVEDVLIRGSAAADRLAICFSSHGTRPE